MNSYHVNGNPITLGERLGGGLEAEVFRAEVGGAGYAAKIFLTPDHDSFRLKPNAPELRRDAAQRLAEQQRKLPGFPTTLPKGILGPIDLIRDSITDNVAGYTMCLLPAGCEGARLYADPNFRDTQGISNSTVVPLLLELHDIIRAGHAEVIFGDALSGNNVQFGNDTVWMIDADSIETPGFPNLTHTREFIDPLLCGDGKLVIKRAHTRDADWFAFNVLVAWLLTLVHPYFDGFYLPDDEMSDEDRAFKGISIFHPEVKLPKKAIDPKYLPDDLVQHLRLVFEGDSTGNRLRGEFPRDLLENFTWVTCACGAGHARDTCPDCGAPVTGGKQTRQGNVLATDLFTAPDGENVVSVAIQAGSVRYGWSNGQDLHRENGSVLPGVLTAPDMRVLVSGDCTAIHAGTTLTIYAPDGTVAHQVTDVATGDGMVGSNSAGFYWINPNGTITRIPNGGQPHRLGVLSGPDPKMWIGEKFGVAFWRQVTGRVYVFGSQTAGIKPLPLPAIPGNLIDVHCTISSSIAFLMLTLERAGTQYNYCYAITPEGTILASAEAPRGDGSWLGSNIRTHAVTGGTQYVPTDSGIVRVEIVGTAEAAQFVARDPHANSAPFVKGADRLLVGPGGMITVTQQTLTQLVNN